MFVIFFLLWIVLNGRLTLEIVLLGLLLSVLFSAFVSRFMGRSLREELKWIRRWPAMLRYFFVLVCEIVKSNIAVMRLILSPRTEVEPQLVSVTTRLKTEEACTLLANSITLTPGTITVRIQEDYLQIHCLDNSLAEGIGNSVFVRLLHEMEEEKK